jgi:hypothetical protein
MIQAILFQNKKKDFYGFWLKGHAGYANYGKDIVCAAVSALAINTVNSIEAFSSAKYKVEEEDGNLKFCLLTRDSVEATLLLKSFALGLSQIEESYGSKYIRISYRE